MKTTTIHQLATFKTTPQAFFAAFMDSALHTRITGSPAELSLEIGGEFSAHGGYCFGQNRTLIPGELIEQTWTALDDNWPEGHVSTIRLELAEKEGKTHLAFTHEDVPEPAAEAIADGWQTYYWKPFQQHFKGS